MYFKSIAVTRDLPDTAHLNMPEPERTNHVYPIFSKECFVTKTNKKPKNNLPFFERPDLSPFLVHLTRRSQKPNKKSAFKNLISILKSGQINSSGPDGFIKGYKRATCFMDTPLSSLKYVLNERDTQLDNPRYEPYGVVITKKLAFKKGCRPVMYLSPNEEKKNRNIQARALESS